MTTATATVFVDDTEVEANINHTHAMNLVAHLQTQGHNAWLKPDVVEWHDIGYEYVPKEER